MRTLMRVARPVGDLERAVRMYREALALDVVGRFEAHAGFDGVMLGRDGLDYHFEFTVCRAHPVAPAPTVDDLIVFYLPDAADWAAACARFEAAGFARVASFNPYWDAQGRTYVDPDGYRTVLQQAAWRGGRAE
ncbi:VOC family protein [Burkholderia plantarii]|uniref:VOC family protein n=1 Tax=Burkholderia plantarii TaxID=41899 RepID=UPI0018DB9072|nr:VOC family protein [Burkholderia plantarii]MBI0329949.1 VOC family protein [Burkholderia plantarii]